MKLCIDIYLNLLTSRSSEKSVLILVSIVRFSSFILCLRSSLAFFSSSISKVILET